MHGVTGLHRDDTLALCELSFELVLDGPPDPAGDRAVVGRSRTSHLLEQVSRKSHRYGITERRAPTNGRALRGLVGRIDVEGVFFVWSHGLAGDHATDRITNDYEMEGVEYGARPLRHRWSSPTIASPARPSVEPPRFEASASDGKPVGERATPLPVVRLEA